MDTHTHTHVRLHTRMHVCTHARTHACMPKISLFAQVRVGLPLEYKYGLEKLFYEYGEHVTLHADPTVTATVNTLLRYRHWRHQVLKPCPDPSC